MISVLQLDTAFPRIAGDVASPDSYAVPLEVLRVPRADVAGIVRSDPGAIDIAPFEDALSRAQGDIVATSCGFLSFWQDHLAAHTDRPFVSSSLVALEHLSKRYTPEELLIVTFDAKSLTAAHLGAHAAFEHSIVGLPPTSHLREVISQDSATLDQVQAEREVVELVRQHQRPRHRHILFECTNLPPYRRAVMNATGLPVSDILTEIERTRPGSIAAAFT